MGEKCSKLTGNNYNRQCSENPANPFADIENLNIEQTSLVNLNFYSDFEKEFPILRHFLLSDYMNLLNSFKSDREMNPSNANDITEETLTKDDWMRFFDNKILKNPIITKLNISQHDALCQKQFWDDLFDDVRETYSTVSREDGIEVPKSAFFAVGFLFCKNKTSQKIMIMINLFTGKDNKVSFGLSAYVFFFLIFTNLLQTPIRVFDKFCGTDMDKHCYLGKIKSSDVTGIKNNLRDLNGIVTNLANDLMDVYFKSDDISYTKDEFKKKLLEKENNWIFSNNRLKAKIEEKMKEKEITIK